MSQRYSAVGCVWTGHIVPRQAARHAEVQSQGAGYRCEASMPMLSKREVFCSIPWAFPAQYGPNGVLHSAFRAGIPLMLGGNQQPIMRKRRSCNPLVNCVADGLQIWLSVACIFIASKSSNRCAGKKGGGGGDNAASHAMTASRALVCTAFLLFSPSLSFFESMIVIFTITAASKEGKRRSRDQDIQATVWLLIHCLRGLTLMVTQYRFSSHFLGLDFPFGNLLFRRRQG